MVGPAKAHPNNTINTYRVMGLVSEIVVCHRLNNDECTLCYALSTVTLYPCITGCLMHCYTHTQVTDDLLPV